MPPPFPPRPRPSASGPAGSRRAADRAAPPVPARTPGRAELAADPHPALARLRERGPACWVPGLGAWLVTGYDLAVGVLRDARTFTVDDPRFSTARIVGPSMLSLDGARHARHRGPFAGPFRAGQVQARLGSFIGAEAGRLVAAVQPRGRAELRRAVAGPLAAAVMARALGLARSDAAAILGAYDGIVADVQAGAVTEAGTAAFGWLAGRLRAVLADPPPGCLLDGVTGTAAAGTLTEEEAVSNAAVLMFGGIETTEGMIANALLHLLQDPAALAAVRADPDLVPAAVEESLRLEPAAASVDRYATRAAELGDARVRAGEQVTVSIAGANRDPAVFAAPDRFDLGRPGPARHLTFARGPHFCIGAHLARLEAGIAVRAVLARLPGLRLDPRYPSVPAGLVFRKPAGLHACWDQHSA